MFKTGESKRFAEISSRAERHGLPFDWMERNIVTREEICLDRSYVSEEATIDLSNFLPESISHRSFIPFIIRSQS
jgi:hypothetical protein